MMRRHRHTVMDGRVVSFAIGFRKVGEGMLGSLYEATGPFEISASRNAVVVHTAELKDAVDFKQFNEALAHATLEHSALRKCDGRPPIVHGDDGAPKEIK